MRKHAKILSNSDILVFEKNHEKTKNKELESCIDTLFIYTLW